MKLLVGLSGGIDSTVTAYKLIEEGHNIIGIYLNISDNNAEKENLNKIQDLLKIEILQPEVKKIFEDTVITHFREEHLKGRSPSPCGFCNSAFKWKIMEEEAKNLQCENLSTGHYINKEFFNKEWTLKKGVDQSKDQSYFLWKLSPGLIKKIYTPLGKRLKEETYTYAKKRKLNFLIEKAESTGLCFSESLSYPKLLERYIPEIKDIPEGDIINSSGKKTGKHKGYIYYTIGQKKDLSLFENHGECVINIDYKNNCLIAGMPEELWKTEFIISETVFGNVDFVLNCSELEVKIRGFGWNPEGYCNLSQIGNDKYIVKLSNKAWAPAPGQPAVFYYKEYLLGGGIID